MSSKRPPKKSEVLEVRIAHEAKMALMRKAQMEGRSASAVVREFIASYVEDEDRKARTMFVTGWKPAAVAGGLAIAIAGSVLAPTRASAGPDFRAAFERLDRNRDQQISPSEFMATGPDMFFVERSDQRAAGEPQPFILPLGRELPPPPAPRLSPPKDLLQAEFRSHDRDGDGTVNFTEFEQYHLGMFKAGFAALDTDRDGFLNSAEYTAAASKAPGGAAAPFAQLDADRDGRISQDEFFG